MYDDHCYLDLHLNYSAANGIVDMENFKWGFNKFKFVVIGSQGGVGTES